MKTFFPQDQHPDAEIVELLQLAQDWARREASDELLVPEGIHWQLEERASGLH